MSGKSQGILKWMISGNPDFYTPVEDVDPSVNFSCLLHNSDTVQDIFMKLGTNINR